jgi:hypothetical protein
MLGERCLGLTQNVSNCFRTEEINDPARRLATMTGEMPNCTKKYFKETHLTAWSI